MRTFSGLDRVATAEELHQVLAVLDELTRDGWVLPSGTPGDPQLWADAFQDDSDDAETLAELVKNKAELKN